MNERSLSAPDLHDQRGSWTPLLPGILGVAVVGLYWPTLMGLWADWLNDPNYSHGILVLPVMVWLLWRQRAVFQTLERRPSYAGALIVAAALAVFAVGNAGFEFFLTRISLVGVLAGILVQLLGWRHLRLCIIPLLLLAASIPLPALIFNQIALPLQLLASRFGVAALGVASIPAVREGNIILLEHATLEVAEACSGIRSLISLGTVTIVYGYLSGQASRTRAVLALAVFPVVIVASGLRVAAAGAVAHAYGAQAAAGFLHTVSGLVFFGAALLMLVAVGRATRAVGWPGAPSHLKP